MAAFALHLAPRQSRMLAVALLALAVLLAIALLLAPFLLLHRHYDVAIQALEDRIEVYRRVAAQTPELKKGLDALRQKDGRRFFLRNTAPNLAGAELQELVRAAIESNNGRITTIQTAQPREDGRFRQISSNVQLFASTPNLQKILYALETQTPYVMVENITIRPLNAFRGFKPAAGNEPELSVLLDVSGFALAEGDKKEGDKKEGDKKEGGKK